MKVAIRVKRILAETGERLDLRLVGIYSYRLNYMEAATGRRYSEPMFVNGKFLRLKADLENRLRKPLDIMQIPAGLKGLRYCRFCDLFTFQLKCVKCLKPTVKVYFYWEEIT